MSYRGAPEISFPHRWERRTRLEKAQELSRYVAPEPRAREPLKHRNETRSQWAHRASLHASPRSPSKKLKERPPFGFHCSVDPRGRFCCDRRRGGTAAPVQTKEKRRSKPPVERPMRRGGYAGRGPSNLALARRAEDRKDEAAADAVASVEKSLESKLETTMEKIEAAAVPMEEIEVGPVGEFLIKWGFKDDPRIPEDERIPAMQRIKDSGKAGVIAYALTEGAFWIGSVPFAIAAVTLATGSLPDFASDEGKAAIGADAFIFINFARLIVPARIAFALGLAPWVDENIVKKFGGDEQAEE